MQILVLDDSNVMRSILVNHLLTIGLKENEIHEAHNGADALRKLQSQSFDLLLLDIVMDGIDGISVLKEAKKIQPDARVIMCSSFSESDTVKELIDLGINDFIVKPFSEEKLKETLLRNIIISN
ncbi:MAG: response regulator [Negativicutes bacterium]|nr:response regulator [Negativicutes bacterium]